QTSAARWPSNPGGSPYSITPRTTTILGQSSLASCGSHAQAAMRSTAVNSPLTRPWQGPLSRLQSGVAALACRAQLFALQKKNRSEKVAPAVEAVGASRCSSVTSIYEVQMVPQPEQQVASSGGMSPVANSALALPPIGGGGLSPSATLPASGPAPA